MTDYFIFYERFIHSLFHRDNFFNDTESVVRRSSYKAYKTVKNSINKAIRASCGSKYRIFIIFEEAQTLYEPHEADAFNWNSRVREGVYMNKQTSTIHANILMQDAILIYSQLDTCKLKAYLDVGCDLYFSLKKASGLIETTATIELPSNFSELI